MPYCRSERGHKIGILNKLIIPSKRKESDDICSERRPYIVQRDDFVRASIFVLQPGTNPIDTPLNTLAEFHDILSGKERADGTKAYLMMLMTNCLKRRLRDSNTILHFLDFDVAGIMGVENLMKFSICDVNLPRTDSDDST